MISSLWIAKTGLDAQLTNLNIIANNLANVNTNGFKKSRAIFKDLIYQNDYAIQKNNQQINNKQQPHIQLGTGVKTIATERINTPGNLSHTGSWNDLAIHGPGFFQIQLENGDIAFTKDGAFQLNNMREIVTNNGLPLFPSIIIPKNSGKINIAKDGVVSISSNDHSPDTEIGKIQLAKFNNSNGLESIGNNLYRSTKNSGTPILNALDIYDNNESIMQGYLEKSNVNITEELVNMIQAQRAYEINSKVLTVIEQMFQKLSQL
ncbi:flagellar basal-body rod protein [Buchnera aphidicola (Cinara tujafilina)]|uniref:Flagellar basal-body rod protein FlgG n=1 Tax=Buchnera aphidicola (Cinara tujafilina) TaxID=261317 RepID=F7WZE3_9GAMM|nr:flagellar basal-body rod protein FlgG [Buchnera aphidicola]AEH39805.1 flagellar basal-body rod protein [Buchnera aphidicola (Cinara tujafilina)]